MTCERFDQCGQADGALVCNVRNRKSPAWDKFYDDNHLSLHQSIWRKVPTSQDAEDCVSEAFMRTLEDILDPEITPVEITPHADDANGVGKSRRKKRAAQSGTPQRLPLRQRLDTDESVQQRLYQNAIHAARQLNAQLRSERKGYYDLSKSYEAEVADEALGELRDRHRREDADLDNAAQNEQRRLILDTLDTKLKPQYREVLQLHFLNGITVEDLIPILGVTHRNTVDQRIKRARSRFAYLLDRAYRKALPNTFPLYHDVVERWQARMARKAQLTTDRQENGRRRSQPPVADDPS